MGVGISIGLIAYQVIFPTKKSEFPLLGMDVKAKDIEVAVSTLHFKIAVVVTHPSIHDVGDLGGAIPNKKTGRERFPALLGMALHP